MVFLFLLSCQWYLPIWGGFPTSKRANRSMLFTIPISNEWTLISTVVRLLGGRRVAPSAWMSSATTLTLGPVQCQNKTLNLFLNIRRRHTIKIYLLVIDSAKLWDGLWTNYCRLIFHRCTKHGAVTWSQWVARKKCLEIGIILLEKNEKQPQISYIYSTSFLRSLFRRLQSSGKPMLRDCVPPVSTSLVSSQTIRRFSGSGISMCGDLFLIFLAGCLALKDFLLMNIVWCIKPNLQRLELENIFRPGCLGAIF